MYNADVKWADEATQLSTIAARMRDALYTGHMLYDEWQNYRAGRSNADIATALSTVSRTVTSEEVAEMDAAYAGFEQLYKFATNQTAQTGDWMYSIRKFS